MADSKPVKQEVNGTVILPPLVFPGSGVSTPKVCYVAKWKYQIRIDCIMHFFNLKGQKLAQKIHLNSVPILGLW